MKFEKCCGAIIIDNEKVLIVKHQKGHFDFPKGHVENNETEVETALREVKEETSLEIELDERKRYVISYSPKEGTIKEVIFFLAKPITKEVKPQVNEIAEIKWLSFEEAVERITYDNSRELLKQVMTDYPY